MIKEIKYALLGRFSRNSFCDEEV